MFTWARRGGYEVSSKGDKRFSALNAYLADGRTIEMWYQCDQKSYEPGGLNWRLGKGKPHLKATTIEEAYEAYKGLWRQWATANPHLMMELRHAAISNNCVLSDCFASTSINQARALAELLNEGY